MSIGLPPQKSGGTLDFYFDFISPYGYFGSLCVEDFASDHGLDVEWRPMLLGISVLKVMKLPPLPERPLMGRYHLEHAIPRHARLHGIHIARNLAAPPPNPIAAARAFCLVKRDAPQATVSFARAVLHAHWAEGTDVVSDPQELAAIAARLGAPADAVAAARDDPDAAALLRSEVDASIARGVFGSPTFIVDNEPFFGVESLPTLDLWLKRRRETGDG